MEHAQQYTFLLERSSLQFEQRNEDLVQEYFDLFLIGHMALADYTSSQFRIMFSP
jgi:hypothetical protein